jgi:hypothetical protein
MTLSQQLNIFTGMALLRCDKLNPTMAMVMVTLFNCIQKPLTTRKLPY